MIYSAVRRQSTAGGRGTHERPDRGKPSPQSGVPRLRRSFLTLPLPVERTQRSRCRHSACSTATAMVERVCGHDSFSDALERTLDMGVALPAATRLTPMTTRDGDVRVEIVVTATDAVPTR